MIIILGSGVIASPAYYLVVLYYLGFGFFFVAKEAL
jgi:hypothetical protein